MRFGIRELLFVLVLVGLPVVAYAFVFRPINQQIQQVYADNQAKQAKLDRLELAKHIDDLGKEIARLNEALQVFEAKLPAEKEVEVILREVWQLAAERQLRPRSVHPMDPVVMPSFTEQPIKMEIVGDFDGFYSFLAALEKLSRITRIPKMKLEQAKDRAGHVVAELTLSIFFETRTAKPDKGGGRST